MLTQTREVPLIMPDLPGLDDVREEFAELLKTGKITNFGHYVTRFESEAGAYVGAETATVSSGTMGLLLSLQALGIKRGDKVIVPSFTFMATIQAILYSGAVPVFAEVSPYLTLDPQDLSALLQQHRDVAAVIGVHMYGLPCAVERIERIVSDHNAAGRCNVAVLYDAAHAFGSAVNGRRVGSFGRAEVFSLSVTKTLVCVEGGLIASSDPELIDRIRHMRNYGIEANYDAWHPGLNGKMSEFHAVIGLYNLRRFDTVMMQRQARATYYSRAIVELCRSEVLPVPEGVVHTFKDFTVLLPREVTRRRGELIAWLKDVGIETRPYFYPPAHKQKLFAGYADRPLPATDALAARVLTLPFFTRITESDMDYVAERLAQAEQEHR